MAPILDLPLEHPMSRRRRYAVKALGAAIVCVIAFLYLWYVGYPLSPLGLYQERATVRSFLSAVESGNMQQAYQIWQPSPSYSFQDFLNDWGTEGYYGPVRSFRIEHSERPHGGGSSVVIKVQVSSDQPFPDDASAAARNSVKEFELWVDIKDQSISFPPY